MIEFVEKDRTEHAGRAQDGAADNVPDLADLARMVASDEEETGDDQNGTTEHRVSVAALGRESADDNRPTDFYTAVKPRPKAVPIAEVGADDIVPLLGPDAGVSEHETAAFSPGRALILGAMIAIFGGVGFYFLLGDRAGSLMKGPAFKASSSRPLSKRRSRLPLDHSTSPLALVMRKDGTQRKQSPGYPPGRADQRTPEPFRIGVQTRGNAVVVPVRLMGPKGVVETKMIFDTGATLTTISQRVANRLGLAEGRAPHRVQTAAGDVDHHLTVVDGISLGGALVHRGLAVELCEACATKGNAGLLGLNFSRNFVVTLDHEAGVLTLKPKALAQPELFDIRHFVTLSDATSARSGRTLTLRFAIHNASPRPVRDIAVVAYGTGTKTMPRTQIASLAADEKRQVSVSIAAPRDIPTYRLHLVEASW